MVTIRNTTLRSVIIGADAPNSDIYYPNVVLLLHGEGANSGTIFTDSSTNIKIASSFGSIVTTTTTSKFGSASIDFGNSGNNYLSYTQANNPVHYTDFDMLSSDDYTVECWAYPYTSSGSQTLVSFRECSPMRLMIVNGALVVQAGNDGITILDSGVLSWSPQWYHFAATKDGNNYRLFRDGILLAAFSSAIDYKSGPGYPLYIGINAGYIWPYRGLMDELRITRGIARYTGLFTPPASAFPNS